MIITKDNFENSPEFLDMAMEEFLETNSDEFQDAFRVFIKANFDYLKSEFDYWNKEGENNGE